MFVTNMFFDTSSIRVIGFDLDQTLYPKSPEVDEAIQKYIYEKIAEHRSCSLEEARNLFREQYQEGKGLSGSKSLEALGVPNAREIVQEALERADIASTLVADPRTLELLTYLKSKYKNIDIVTGSNSPITLKKLEKLNLSTALFNHLITDSDAAKSDGEAYRLWLSKYPNLTPTNFLYIGDRVSSDYEIPKTLGIKSVLVNLSKKDEMLPVLQLSSLLELKDIL
jgi:FMN phosphatase YigB (HAD superfamily)